MLSAFFLGVLALAHLAVGAHGKWAQDTRELTPAGQREPWPPTGSASLDARTTSLLVGGGGGNFKRCAQRATGTQALAHPRRRAAASSGAARSATAAAAPRRPAGRRT